MSRPTPIRWDPSANPREDAVEAFNKLSEVMDFLQVLGMALASEDGAEPFSELATVANAARQHARAGYEAAGRVCRFYEVTARQDGGGASAAGGARG